MERDLAIYFNADLGPDPNPAPDPDPDPVGSKKFTLFSFSYILIFFMWLPGTDSQIYL